MSGQPKPSLLRMAYMRSGVVLLVIVVAAAINLAIVRKHTDATDAALVGRIVAEYVQVINQQLVFYRDVLKQLARQIEVQNLLLLDDKEGAAAWALKQRAYLPRNVGLALIGAETGILGTPVDLRVGPACVRDLHQRLGGAPLREPLIHRENPALAHFDLLEPVVDESGRYTGLIFASFDLQTLRATLNHSLQGEQYLELRDGYGGIIASAGAVKADAVYLEQQAPIPGSTWTLVLRQAAPPKLPMYLAFSGTNLVASIAIIALFILMTMRIMRTFAKELGKLKDVLVRVSARQAVEMPAADYRETEAIMPLIEKLALDIQAQQEKLTELSLTDDLTEIPNRRHFAAESQRAFEFAQRGTPMCLLIFDIDRFKAVNDSLGHAAGDAVLKKFADVLRRSVRRTDFVARLGGDEFAAILFDSTLNNINALLERIKNDFADAQGTNNPQLCCTLSIGATNFGYPTDVAPYDVLRRADEMLYRAKANGRARVEVAYYQRDGVQKNSV